jgi:hypothetical protein
MFAVITFDNVFSGLIGAAFGVVASAFNNWLTSKRSARDALREELIKLKIFKVYEVGKGRGDFLKIYHDSYPHIASAVLAYRSRLFFCRKIDRAWKYYRAGDKPDRLHLIRFSHVDVCSDEEFQKRIDLLLDVVD